MGTACALSHAFQGMKVGGSNTEGVQPVKRMPSPTTQDNGEDKFGSAASACEVVLLG